MWVMYNKLTHKTFKCLVLHCRRLFDQCHKVTDAKAEKNMGKASDWKCFSQGSQSPVRTLGRSTPTQPWTPPSEASKSESVRCM